jgi:nitrogen regulatory protein PII
MKSVFIVFNQANTEKMEYIFDMLNIRGFTWWQDVQGRGSMSGEPRQGTHTWPEMNSAAMTVIPDEMVEPLLEKVRKLDALNKEIGVKAFVWNIEQVV